MTNSLISLFDSFSVMLRIQDGAECGKTMHEYSNYFKQKKFALPQQGSVKIWQKQKEVCRQVDNSISRLFRCRNSLTKRMATIGEYDIK